MAGVECAYDGKHLLGECPVWNGSDKALYWVDIYGRTINRLDRATGKGRTWPLPDAVGAIGRGARDGMVAATKRGFHFFDLKTGKLEQIADPENPLRHNRSNDGRCDRRGRFGAAKMGEVDREPTGSLYCLDVELSVRVVRSGVIIPNSLSWSRNDRVMYFADTERHKIWAYDYDIETGTVANERVFVDTKDRVGRPDGSTVDAEDCLWNAEYGGGRICRYTPDGGLARVIEMPGTQPTSCACGGAGLETLYITTARQRLNPQQIEQQPLAGALFAVRPGVSGVPEPSFAG